MASKLSNMQMPKKRYKLLAEDESPSADEQSMLDEEAEVDTAASNNKMKNIKTGLDIFSMVNKSAGSTPGGELPKKKRLTEYY